MAGLVWLWGTLSTVSAYAVAFWLKDATVPEQVLGIATVRAAISVLIHFPVHVTILKVFSGMSWRRVASVLAPAAIAGAVAFGATALLRTVAPLASLPQIAALAAAGVTAVLAGGSTLLLLDPAARRLLRRQLARRSAAQRSR